ncbi:SH3 domain-containing protein [Xylanibacter ruminicola]|jgi:uncharacterized protein YgiM (DUF1202 family)|uniref:SH3 domain-containing protein n=1 Tax=Xylanibacter ruminicola TaxID=839 RepID=A0A1M6RLX0_XYLRU|nr:SH3 domain-containing protein [Xylanibacter ruminicola]SHK33400.1 hypothetical protein SAMN05216463_10218 [Xylanibacter ruminicola]
MKSFIKFLIVVLAGCWVYYKCSGNSSQNDGVLKQVKVAVKTANLRTGPGTSYGFVTVSGNTDDKLLLSGGDVLDVLAEEDGWYQVRISDNRIAYIKQSLCTDISKKNTKSSKTKKSSKSSAAKNTGDTPKNQEQPAVKPQKAATPEDVVEEVKGGQADDEVIF